MNTARIVEAVNLLILTQNYARLTGEIRQIAENWDNHPMAYSGQLAPLNALIDVALTNTDAFDRLLTLAEERRRKIPQLKRTDYQRVLMRERRDRLAKALRLHETKRGKLRPEERRSFAAEVQSRWRAEREAYIEAKGDLTWKDRNAAAQEFWERIDRNLDQALHS